MDHRLEVDLFRRHQRKARGQVKTKLVAKDAARASAGAVSFLHALVADVTKQIKIGLHRRFRDGDKLQALLLIITYHSVNRNHVSSFFCYLPAMQKSSKISGNRFQYYSLFLSYVQTPDVDTFLCYQCRL